MGTKKRSKSSLQVKMYVEAYTVSVLSKVEHYCFERNLYQNVDQNKYVLVVYSKCIKTKNIKSYKVKKKKVMKFNIRLKEKKL